MTPIKDVSNYKIINASLSTFKHNLNIFNANLLTRTEEFFLSLLTIVSHDNREVKENASEVFEKYIDSLAVKLEEDENRHKVEFIH